MLKIFKHHIPVWSVLELVADSLLCFAAVLLAAARLPGATLDPQRHAFPSSDVLLWAAGFAGFMALLYSFVGLYRQGAIRVSLRALFGRGLVALSMGSCIAYAALQADGNRDYALLLLLYAVPVMAVGVIAVRSVGYLARRAAVGARRVLIVGTGAEALSVATDLAADSAARHLLVGFYPTSADEPAASLAGIPVPIFPMQLSIDDVVQKHRVDEVIVAVREQRGGGVPMDQLLACRIRGIPVLDLAGFFERAKGEVPTDSLKASWLVYGHGFVQDGVRTAVKRAFDLVMSLVLLLIASPIMVITAIAIKLDSRGPLIYRQERVGLGGRSFMCLKFRSMSVDAEKDGVARWATKNDSRVTRVGAFIRKCRIDELPQLISVLRGEMSLVGPRPERPSFVQQLQAEIPFYDIRHSVKPGVTGWAQVRYSYGASVEDARRKHQFDLYYVKNHSLFLDLLVLVETVSVVLFREGAQ
ncbi:TIGR03013 family XrtA/PEP-CTERM system glycosyltransferase [Piscinibacter sp. XHJ-5]|uniref:TIGR03013 family XrtA/PEP-CTERM system glycosyltransferase n=1 Tax=Piscinibacter sp. XHJ-5 TaxID=3037797 RepID=UPI002453269C|nr:TIGR03013 family XrtA/PEP-CTERM system glycosyltransferase [Piscinibacter sp. XHJ-5]